ncbi:hypothetical protein EVAR_7022_1 [Eumeta japonica]|uniref:Uncharacterized protein n=1 Tax=Eumeta variegata TaxID=151549 RepID=A0A4C1TJC6_EUMVA|nr:hypothetical protein EVAR_7022_1 [Eumeta japonica]
MVPRIDFIYRAENGHQTERRGSAFRSIGFRLDAARDRRFLNSDRIMTTRTGPTRPLVSSGTVKSHCIACSACILRSMHSPMMLHAPKLQLHCADGACTDAAGFRHFTDKAHPHTTSLLQIDRVAPRGLVHHGSGAAKDRHQRRGDSIRDLDLWLNVVREARSERSNCT